MFRLTPDETWTKEEMDALTAWQEEKREQEAAMQAALAERREARKNYNPQWIETPRPADPFPPQTPLERRRKRLFEKTGIPVPNDLDSSRLASAKSFAMQSRTIFGDTNGLQVTRQANGNWKGVSFRVGFGEHTKRVGFSNDASLREFVRLGSRHSDYAHSYRYDGKP